MLIYHINWAVFVKFGRNISIIINFILVIQYKILNEVSFFDKIKEIIPILRQFKRFFVFKMCWMQTYGIIVKLNLLDFFR
jgi:hypothetical protein